MFNNKKIFILGMARSGYECAKLLSSKGCNILVTDSKNQDESHVKELEDLGVKVVITEDQVSLLDNSFDYVVKNPGVKLDNVLILKAIELGIKVINEVEVAYHYLPNVSIIGITGSNGKTTTTTLIYEILKSAGIRVHLGGNIGYPVCSLVNKSKDNDVLVLEISGHQLHDCFDFKTNISVITNLSPVHLDHFGNYENYKYNKLKILNNHKSDDICIYNIGNLDVVNGIKDINDKKISFTSNDNISSDLYLKDNYIYYKNEKIINISDIKLKGNHNYENVMCAIACAKEYNVSNEIIKKVLSSFNGVEHRMEYVRTIDGIEFYNDSKSTNIKSTQIALSSFNKDVYLLLGGLDRGNSFDELKDYMKNVKLVLCYGETKNKIKEFCDSLNIKCIVNDTLIDSVLCAYKNATNNSVILLSPACASWDQYDSFETRGNEFKKTVNNI